MTPPSPKLAVRLKFEELVTVPTPATVTCMNPEVAPAGSVVVIAAIVDCDTAAVVPLNFTVFWLAVALNQSP